MLPTCVPADEVPPVGIEIYPVRCSHYLAHETVGPLSVDDNGPVFLGKCPDFVNHHGDQSCIVFVERRVVLDKEIGGIASADNSGHLVSGETTTHRESGYRAAEFGQDAGKITAYKEKGVTPDRPSASIQPVNHHPPGTGNHGNHPFGYEDIGVPFEVHMPGYRDTR